MKKKYKISITFLCLLSLLLLIKTINLYQDKNKLIENIYSNSSVVNKKDSLTMMLETDYNTDEYLIATSSEWPSDEYIFNAEMSTCKNDSELSWDSDTNKVIVYSKNQDSCYIYFDKKKNAVYFADYIKNTVYTGDGNNGLYYHDGVGNYTNAAQEAGDNSYRFSGANPNNYVCFGSDASVCPYENIYRIIGVFDDNVKLITYDYATSIMLGTNGDYYSSSYSNTNNPSDYYIGSLNQNNVPVYSWNKNGSNTWSASQLNTVNLNVNFINYLNNLDSKWANMIKTTSWQVGGNTSSNIHEVTVKNSYKNEITNPATNTPYNAKVGMF